MPALARTDWTVDMLDALPDDDQRHEIIDGELFVTPAPSNVHQLLVGELLVRFRTYLRGSSIARAIMSPSDVRRPDRQRNRVQPDVYVFRLRNNEHPAYPFEFSDLLLVIEVVSPSSTVLLIQGRGTIPVANGVGVRTVFESAGLLSFDMASRQFKWVASGGTGYLGISDAQVRSDTLVWFTSDASGARVRYTICHSAAGEWHETGETSKDGLTWLRSFQMTLVRDKALDGGRPSRP